MNQSKVTIGLSNPKSPYNVSSVRRSAGNFSVDEIFYTGTRYPRALSLNDDLPKMSRAVSQSVPVTAVDQLLDAKAQGTKLICVEFAINASSLINFKHPENAYYVFGPEDGTLDQEIIDSADAVVYIPTVGCMNLAATVNVLLYDRLAKSGLEIDDDKVIRQSRDRNNNIKARLKQD